jgi:hypothetical protein
VHFEIGKRDGDKLKEFQWEDAMLDAGVSTEILLKVREYLDAHYGEPD